MKCHMYGCNRLKAGSFYCVNHDVDPRSYGYTAKNKIPLYGTWVNMLYRCYEPTCKTYRHYGGRGVSVCDDWRDSFSKFVADMGDKPVRHSLDRIDVNGNYEPLNTRWATYSEQAYNKRKQSAV